MESLETARARALPLLRRVMMTMLRLEVQALLMAGKKNCLVQKPALPLTLPTHDKTIILNTL